MKNQKLFYLVTLELTPCRSSAPVFSSMRLEAPQNCCPELLEMGPSKASTFPRMKKMKNLSSPLYEASLKVTFKKFYLGLLHLHPPHPHLLCAHPPRCNCKYKARIPQLFLCARNSPAIEHSSSAATVIGSNSNKLKETAVQESLPESLTCDITEGEAISLGKVNSLLMLGGKNWSFIKILKRRLSTPFSTTAVHGAPCRVDSPCTSCSPTSKSSKLTAQSTRRLLRRVCRPWTPCHWEAWPRLSPLRLRMWKWPQCRPELFAQHHHGKSVLPSDPGCAAVL